MKILFIISTAILCGLFSCTQTNKQDKPKEETPEALQEKSYTDVSLLSKRGYDDLFESLYNEVAEKTPEIKRLEEAIDKLNVIKIDSLSSFEKFNQKNTLYYASADKYLHQIKDSLLRKKISSLIGNSLLQYGSKIEQHKTLIALLETGETNLNDLHIFLKIVTTLPLIEKYQAENIPSPRSINEIVKAFDSTAKKIEIIARK